MVQHIPVCIIHPVYPQHNGRVTLVYSHLFRKSCFGWNQGPLTILISDGFLRTPIAASLRRVKCLLVMDAHLNSANWFTDSMILRIRTDRRRVQSRSKDRRHRVRRWGPWRKTSTRERRRAAICEVRTQQEGATKSTTERCCGILTFWIPTCIQQILYHTADILPINVR